MISTALLQFFMKNNEQIKFQLVHYANFEIEFY
jgi:hypothetical protein